MDKLSLAATPCEAIVCVSIGTQILEQYYAKRTVVSAALDVSWVISTRSYQRLGAFCVMLTEKLTGCVLGPDKCPSVAPSEVVLRNTAPAFSFLRSRCLVLSLYAI